MLLVLWLTLLTSEAAEPRLAILSIDPRCAPAEELLTAEFSRSEYGLALLDRAEVERVRREQTLTARSSADFARLGQMLGAHGVLVLDFLAQKDATNLTVKLIAVQPGVALGLESYTWPLREIRQWPGIAGKQFGRLLPKLTVLSRDAIPISILNLRSALKTSEGVRLENEATTVLIHRLIAQPEIFVLERQRMATLEAEKELKEAQDSPFWNGSYLLEGVIERGGATRDAASIQARLVSPAKSSETLVVKSDSGDLRAMVDGLARDVILRLARRASNVTWNPAAEGKRYLEEAKWGSRWQNHRLAQFAADSAWALGEQNLDAALIRVNSRAVFAPPLWSSEGTFLYNVTPLTPPQTEGLDSFLSAMETYLTLTPALRGEANARPWIQAGEGLLADAAARLCHFWYFPQQATAAKSAIEQMRAQAREIERVLLKGKEEPGASTFADSSATNIWQIRLNFGWSYAESPEAVLEQYRRLFSTGLTRQQREQLVQARHRWMMPYTETERNRASALWTPFLEELLESTNAANGVSAAIMAIRSWLPADRQAAEAALEDRKRRAAKAILRHRRELLCNEPDLALLAVQHLDRVVVQRGSQRAQAADVVRTNFMHGILIAGDCATDKLLTVLFQPAAFQSNHLNVLLGQMGGNDTNVALRKRLLLTYTAGSEPFHADVFRHLFRPTDYAETETRRILSRLNDWRELERYNNPANVSLIDEYIAALQSALNPGQSKATTIPVATATPVSATSGSLSVTQFWRPAFKEVRNQTPTQFVAEYCLWQVAAHDGFLWAQARGRYEFHWPSEEPNWYYISNQFFEQFFRIDPRDMKETASPAVVREEPRVLPLNIFDPPPSLAVHEGILYVHQDRKLTSWDPRETRWRHVAVELPGQMNMQAVNNRFYFGSRDTLLEFNPTNSALRVMASRRRNPPITAEDRLPSYGEPRFTKGTDGTVFVQLSGFIHPWDAATGQWRESFRARAGMFGHLPSGDADQSLTFGGVKESGGWQMPGDAERLRFLFARDKTSVWGIDWTQPKLVYFDVRWDKPLELPLSITPKSLTNQAPAGQQYVYASTPEGLTVFRKFAEGFWLIPQRDLDSALAPVVAARGPARQWSAPNAPSVAPRTNTKTFSWADGVRPDTAQILRRYENSKPGALDMRELVSAIRGEPALEAYRSLIKNFETSLLLIDPYDTNGNQRIDGPELDAMVKAGKPRVTREEFMLKWDTNRNDRLDAMEVSAAIAEKTGRSRRPRPTKAE